MQTVATRSIKRTWRRWKDRALARLGILRLALALPLPDAPPVAIHRSNQDARDAWVRAKADAVPAGARVLDVGAGTCRYRGYFAHCDYRAHDFMEYERFRDGSEGAYGTIDYVSDITALPVPDGSFDLVLCTEVLEHVPHPIEAIHEMARVLRAGGRLLLTAPLGSGLHQLPHHYYGGYTPEWYRRFCPEAGLAVVEIAPNGGFFKLFAQLSVTAAGTFDRHRHLHGDHAEAVYLLFERALPLYLAPLDGACPIDQITIGYHVEAVKSALS